MELNFKNPDLEYLKTSQNPLVLFGTNPACGMAVKRILDKHNIKIDFVAVDEKYYVRNSSFLGMDVSAFENLIDSKDKIDVIVGIELPEDFFRVRERIDNLSKVEKTFHWKLIDIDKISFSDLDKNFIAEHKEALQNLKDNANEIYHNYHINYYHEIGNFSDVNIRRLSIPLADHCNLNCAHCNVFSPVAEPGFPDLLQFEKDLRKLSELTANIGWLSFFGGEPLLNPNITQYLEIARRNMPNSQIFIITNGILLPSMKRDFWECCRNNAIEIEVSLYPIKINWNKIDALSLAYQTKISLFHVRTDFSNHLLDLQGKNNPVVNISLCEISHCTTLRNGKIYRCPLIPFSETLEKRFNISFQKQDKDYIDIHETDALQEIKNHLDSVPSFCRFCPPRASNKQALLKWEAPSSRKLEEWVK